MATRRETIEHVLATLDGLPGVAARAMFGEYALYLDGKVVGLICHDRLFVKDLPEARAAMPEAELDAPYRGARPHLLADPLLDAPERLAALLRAVADALPPPRAPPRETKAPGMTWITDIATLEARYPDPPSQNAIAKVTPRLTPAYRAWIERARFCLLASVGPGGTDCSPRGDDGPVVTVLDTGTLALPDWRGNNRLDSLRNIVADGRVSLTFLVAGSTDVLRVNGTARLSVAPDLLARFDRDGRAPRCVIVVALGEVYMQCAKSLMRARLWTDGDQSAGLPTLGTILQEITGGGVEGAGFDAAFPARARKTLW